ncbi:MAG TPA: DUF222 domain-containing protein [Candidatus Dormibacteraeota bacterium]|nr:DUF222 domain-containing protein [Candidatus Dormibacteraeota bacterium]
MSAELQALEDAITEFELADDDLIDPKRLSSAVDRLQTKLCTVLHRGKQRGDHLLAGKTPVGWVAQACGLSSSSASDRLCVGEQLESLPRVAQALKSGEVGYQSAAVICHFRDKLREDLRENIDQEWWLERAREYSVKGLRWLEQHVRYVVDPDSFDRQVEEDWEKRFLSISESGGMFHITGVLDREGGAALEAAIQSLSKPLGPDDVRTPKQRRADAAVELACHAMDKGSLPKRNGVRPHISVSTTIEGLKREIGAPISHFDNGIPVSNKTVQRLACDATLHRILKADSRVIDVGRARRSAQPSQWRGLKAMHKSCAGPGCDRALNWTHAHHVEFWADGGKTDMRKLLPLCYYHHRLVHEGGWQVVRTADAYQFIPPETPVVSRRRWGERRWAA